MTTGPPRSDRVTYAPPLVLVVVAVLIVLTGALLAGDAVVSLRLTPGRPTSVLDVVYLGTLILVSLPPLAFSLVGAFIIVRRPGNTIAWLMSGLGVFYSIGVFSTDLADYEFRIEHAHGAILVIPTSAANVVWGPVMLSLSGVFMLFPTGRPPGRVWERLLRLGIPLALAAILVRIVTPTHLQGTAVNNPLGLNFLPSFITANAFGIIGLVMLTCFAGLVRRFWLARGEERQQLKWFTYGAAILVVAVPLAIASQFSNVLAIPFFVALTFMPISIGIAILKYRLWDIDALINRTLVYGILSAALGLIYVCGVLGLQAVLGLATGQNSTIAVAISTLIVAALFGPLRRGIQGIIDRRFYRRKYDAAQMLAALGEKLRDEIDLGQVRAEVLGAVRGAMQPEHVSLWLRDPGETPDRGKKNRDH